MCVHVPSHFDIAVAETAGNLFYVDARVDKICGVGVTEVVYRDLRKSDRGGSFASDRM